MREKKHESKFVEQKEECFQNKLQKVIIESEN